MGKTRVLPLPSLVFIIALQAILPFSSAWPTLQVGFYKYTCPDVESIVRNVVYKAVAANPGIGAGIIRMHFHDCFVRGCDASVLLESVNGIPAEKESPANKPSLRAQAFELIDEAKARVESSCPGVVSCADIIALAARDSANFLGGINYDVPSGRRDGRVSLASEVLGNLVSPSSNLDQLQANFASKGLSTDDLVTLSGAHSIGRSHCTSFSKRLSPRDPTLDPFFFGFLKFKCLRDGGDRTVDQDIVTPNRLDNQYYINLKNHRVLFNSDEALLSCAETAAMVEENAHMPSVWSAKFAAAMVKMGSIEVLTGDQGEIRKTCRAVNHY
ncbi:peroxidase 2-like [Typha latifolia]|uniref:peroxidase 2-like n=1 Tax=Typha latifolia TaxID=4733 RepID=UPI003C2C1107